MSVSCNNPPIIVDEHSKKLLKKDTFTKEDIEILESKFLDKVEIILKRNEDEIRTLEYVGYIVLPNNVIIIKPKIPHAGFLSMLGYALDFPELGQEHPELTKGKNYYDILVRFLFLELEKILQRGVYTGYKNYDDNITCIRGKILFKEQLIVNHNRNDKIFCFFSESSPDITENRIIKYTLSYLSHCYFVDNTIDAELIRYYQRLDGVSLTPITKEQFRSIEYTPLNLHYKPILTLCELLLRDSALDEEIGEKTSISFLINMNKLFEEFIGNLLKKRLEPYEIELQRPEHPGKTDTSLRIYIDIMISYNAMPLLIVDTKYQETTGRPQASHLEQLSLYSNTTYVKSCVLVYAGKSQSRLYELKQDITVHVISFDLSALNELEFESKCDDFMNGINIYICSI
jgi:5-methylcytosine-specific restriction enzyme subunit McrC